MTFLLDAVEDFIPRRAQLTARCDHPDITDAEITVGSLRNGRVQALIAVPSGADLGIYRLQVEVSGWLKLSGGLGPDLRWETKLEVVDRDRPRSRRRGGGPGEGDGGPGPGNQVALVWATHEEREGWSAATVGEVEDAAARDLARQNPEYADLEILGDRKIPTLVLNEHFAPLKSYLSGRARTLSGDWIDRLKDQYAVGVGVGLLFLKQQNELRQQDERERRRNGDPLATMGWLSHGRRWPKACLARCPSSMNLLGAWTPTHRSDHLVRPIAGHAQITDRDLRVELVGIRRYRGPQAPPPPSAPRSRCGITSSHRPLPSYVASHGRKPKPWTAHMRTSASACRPFPMTSASARSVRLPRSRHSVGAGNAST